MLRNLSETFTATHLTAILIAAIVTPGAVYAVTYANVAVTDAKSGVTAYVDPTHRLNTYDPIAGYANNPANYVRIYASCVNGVSSFSYSPPSGKAFIAKAVDFTFFEATSGSDNYAYLISAQQYAAGLDSPDASGFKNSDFGNGLFLRNGESMGVLCSTGEYNLAITGYLVPSSAAPPVTAEASAQSVRPAQAIMKNGRPL